MGNLKYCRPSDIVIPQAVSADIATVGGQYGLPALYDLNPAKPCTFIGVGPLRIVYDYGSAQRIDAFGLPNSNLDAGLPCRVEMHAIDSWGAPTVSGTMTTGADHANGHRASPWKDLTQVAGYSASGFRYLSLYVPVNSVNIRLGEILPIARLREFSRWPMWDGTKGAQRRFLESMETEYGVQRVVRRKITQRTLSFSFKGRDTDYADLQSLADDASGVARAFFITADGDVETDGGLYARFTRDTAERIEASEEWTDTNPFTVSVRELSRSLPL
jgi:hypothetical protein